MRPRLRPGLGGSLPGLQVRPALSCTALATAFLHDRTAGALLTACSHPMPSMPGVSSFEAGQMPDLAQRSVGACGPCARCTCWSACCTS